MKDIDPATQFIHPLNGEVCLKDAFPLTAYAVEKGHLAHNESGQLTFKTKPPRFEINDTPEAVELLVKTELQITFDEAERALTNKAITLEEMKAVTEDELQAKATAPRVTAEQLQAEIVADFYFSAKAGVYGADQLGSREIATKHDPYGKLFRQQLVGVDKVHEDNLGLLTFCVLVLRNGYTVHGVSACAAAENFNYEIGCRLARQNAEKQIWPLLGYMLRSRLALEAGMETTYGSVMNTIDRSMKALEQAKAFYSILEPNPELKA